MKFAQEVKEPTAGEWLELANGEEVTFRHRAELPFDSVEPCPAQPAFAASSGV